MTAADTQMFFSKSYLAWSFKPVIGFLMDAIGKTKLVMIFLLLSGAAMYLLTPFFDVSAIVFYWMMFALAILFACTDVAVDRATVLTGDEESRASGRSKAATVGLNHSICWAAIYGTSIVAAAWGGWIADNLAIKYLLFGLAAVPLIVFWVVLQLPRDTARSIPLKDSVVNFWNGMNTGPIVWIILFYFLFHFQPAMGALWTNYLIKEIHFTQTQIGYAEAVSYLGFFMWLGTHGPSMKLCHAQTRLRALLAVARAALDFNGRLGPCSAGCEHARCESSRRMHRALARLEKASKP